MIIHFTTAHQRTDTRILLKEVQTLARRWPGQVALFVQDGKGDEQHEDLGYEIRDTGPPEKGRLRRMTFGAWRMFRAVRRARPTIAHFHDPELLPWAFLLRLMGVKMIYDMHEDLPVQLWHKPYLGKFSASVLSKIAYQLEKLSARVFSGLIVVGPEMYDRLPHRKTILLRNFPIISEFDDIKIGTAHKKQSFVYAGGLSVSRGIFTMIEAVGLLPAKTAELVLMGKFESPEVETLARQKEGWQNTRFLGWSDRQTVSSELAQSMAGLVVLHPTPQYVKAYPVKMFEYMASGLPFIASDFPVLRELIEQHNCGVLVDPESPKEIAEAMQWVLAHPEEAAAMGRRGREAVEGHFSWDAESAKLIALYEDLLQDGKGT